MNDVFTSECAYGKHPRRHRRGKSDSCAPSWQNALPQEWRDRVVVPQSFRVFREFEIPARRVFGYDQGGTICYSAHDYRLIDVRSDDDEDFYETLAYAESVVAWRLNDGRWLVNRRIDSLGAEGESENDLQVEDGMPR
ncbi:hypothetical protein [Thiorhodococcus fuscus]|uniref:Uncharacterized protein n=1 Tax=Thiorhodococcus fuscus TaxID=527200 RepID=A0ABW4YBR0_9GAMM